ncbi:hypothetical protein [Falsirhodobacter algicola]|uniref:Uncharacterized protein n=1 Tax=Falsirhodobacter algicola TaxID=2692330 RepID=A0A8J8MSI2_9RHOB|nr:hypothetical protein [Falsirhodobacter algicola]QUS35709.1 hypothetical protein GR316_05155 [Falsirhodobacter algicola]
MTYRTLGLGLILATIGGAAGAETVIFDPRPGTARTWRMEMTLRPGQEGEPPDYAFDTQHVSALTRIRAVDAKTLRILPLWFQTKIAGDTYGTQGPLPDRMRQAMVDGFDAVVDAGGIADLTPHGSTDVPDDMMAGLRPQFAAVLPPAPIEAEEGWSTTVPNLLGAPEVTLTVTHVTNDSVFLRYSNDDPSFRIAGLVVVDRGEGWVRRAALTTDLHYDDGTTLRSTLAMAPQEYPFAVHADYTFDTPDWRAMPDTLPEAGRLPTEADIFPHDRGRVRMEHDLPSLGFTHLTERSVDTGRFVLNAPQVFEGDRPLEIPMQALPSITLPNYHEEDGDPSFTSTTLIPAEQRQILPKIRDATDIRAQVAWYPASPFMMRLTPDAAGHAEVTKNGATARLSPTEDGYDLVLSGRPEDWFMWAVDGGTDAGSMVYAADRGPDWLTPAESLARRIAAPDYSGIRVAIRTGASSPTFSVRVNRFADAPAAMHDMVFLTDKGQRLDPDHAPQTVRLFQGDPPLGVEDVRPEGLDVAALWFRMGALQADRCTADFADPQTDAVFAKVAPDTDRYDGARLFRMQTADGIRTHFYEGGTQEVTLACDATVTWQEADLQPDADRPWLVDPAALGISADLTLADLMDGMRFVDAQGDALTLATPDGHYLSQGDRVERAIFPDGTLRVAGTPARILRAVSRPDPVARSFTVTFPDLPVPEEAPQ